MRYCNTIWDAVRKYINSSLSVGMISRKIMIEYVQQNYLHQWSVTYLDSLRNQLEKAGYLAKVIDVDTEKIIPGEFMIIKKIPEDLTINELRRQYEASF